MENKKLEKIIEDILEKMLSTKSEYTEENCDEEEKELEEMSGSAGAGAYMTPNAFSKKPNVKVATQGGYEIVGKTDTADDDLTDGKLMVRRNLAKLDELINKRIDKILKEGSVKYRAEVTGIKEDRWSTNALTYNTEKEAERWLDNLKMRWFGYDMGRVVPTTTPKNEKVNTKTQKIYQNFRD